MCQFGQVSAKGKSCQAILNNCIWKCYVKQRGHLRNGGLHLKGQTMQLDTYWDFLKPLVASIQDPNFRWNQCQGNSEHPVRHLRRLSKLLLITPNSNMESSKQEQSLQPPKQRSGTNAVRQRRWEYTAISSAASAAQHSTRGCETHAARRARQGQSLGFATETMQLALVVTFCEHNGEKLFKLLHQNVTFFFLIVGL